MKTIFLSQAIKLTRESGDLALVKGHNVVEDDVAAHWFVAAHTVNAADAADHSDEMAAAQARIAELETANAELQAQVDALALAAATPTETKAKK